MLGRRLFFFAALVLGVAPAAAAEEPTFQITFRDGVIAPSRLEVPAGTRFRLELINEGSRPAEFESKELYKEKVLAPGSRGIMVFKTLSPGEYVFFDDFSPGSPPAVLIAK